MAEYDPEGMTGLMYRYAYGDHLTLEEAREKLYANAYIRTADETLARYCNMEKADTAALRKKVVALLSEADPSAKKDSTERKVRMWFNDRLQYINRKSALQLAFALHLPVKEADELLCRLSGEGFHWRDPEDIIWLFALEHEMSFTEAAALSGRLLSGSRLPGSAENPEVMTAAIHQQVAELKTEEELASFLKESAPLLGTFHNTAYQLFRSFMDLLKSADSGDLLPDERKMPVGEIVTAYLYNNLIPHSGRSREKTDSETDPVRDAIRRDIRQNWPDEFTLARMASRETDVTRKVLILLFLACDGGETDYGDYSDESENDIFEDTSARLNSMLADCGFPPLDSRTPFDWMALYCMAADDAAGIDENMEKFLTGIFREDERPDR